MFQHSVLMDPCFVSEGIFSHHCLVGLNEGSGEVGYQPAGTVNFLGDDIRMVGKQILSRPQCHNDLFKGGIAGTLTDSVDGTFNLPASAFDARQRVGYSQSQVVVAVAAKAGLVPIGNFRNKLFDKGSIFLGTRVADSVGDIDGCGPVFDGRFEDLGQIIDVASGGIFSRKFHIRA